MSTAEICEYPDSGKIGAFARGGMRHMTEKAADVDYWKGE